MLKSGGVHRTEPHHTAEAIRNGIDEILKKNGAPWCAYGEFSGFHVFTNPERQTVTREDIYNGKISWSVLAHGLSAELGHKVRLAAICGGVDLTGWPGRELFSGVHDGQDVDATLVAVRERCANACGRG